MIHTQLFPEATACATVVPSLTLAAACSWMSKGHLAESPGEHQKLVGERSVPDGQKWEEGKTDVFEIQIRVTHLDPNRVR